MSRYNMDALNKAFNLIHTPQALEVLGALSEDRDPYDGSADEATITAAIVLLSDLGAATTTLPSPPSRQHVASITERGRALFGRLVEIENGAASDPRLEASDQ